METRPDILVLGSGGVAGIAWMTGVLAGLEDGSGLSMSACDYLVGTSAGAIVAARLIAGERLQRPIAEKAPTVASDPEQPKPNAASGWALALGGPAAAIAMRLTAPPTAILRATALRYAPQSRRQVDPLRTKPVGTRTSKPADRPGAAHEPDVASGEWDGRLRVVAVERRSGRRVVFGSPGAPDASVHQAVRASCAVPWVFAPVPIAGSDYVDGAVWSPTNLDVAPARRGARVLCIAPTASLHGPRALATRAASRAATLVEAAAISGRGAHVQIVAPDRESATVIGRGAIAQAPAAEILAAGYSQGMAL